METFGPLESKSPISTSISLLKFLLTSYPSLAIVYKNQEQDICLVPMQAHSNQKWAQEPV